MIPFRNNNNMHKYNLDNVAPNDQIPEPIKLNPHPDPVLLPNQEYQKASDRYEQAAFNEVYGTLRFVPYIKYATDFLDVFGLSPDQMGQKDFTDAALWGAIGFDAIANSEIENNEYRAQEAKNGIYRRKGKPVPLYNQNLRDGMENRFNKNANIWRRLKKFNPLRAVNVFGDLKQFVNNSIELYKAYEELEKQQQIYRDAKNAYKPFNLKK